MNQKIAIKDDSQLLDRIGIIINEARQRTAQTVNTILVKTYWEIGREIVEHELGGKIRADYGKETLKSISRELVQEYGKGFSFPNLKRMKQFYLNYQIGSTVSSLFNTTETLATVVTIFEPEKMLTRLSWSHLCLLLAVSDKDARCFYEIETNTNRIRTIK